MLYQPLLVFFSPLILFSHIIYASEDDVSHYNPDVNLDTPQTIRRHGYPVEAHTVETEDGYLLTLHRIPSGHIEHDTSRSCDISNGKLERIYSQKPQPESEGLLSPSQVMLSSVDSVNSSTTVSPTSTTTTSTTTTTTSTTPPTPAPKSRIPILLHHGLMGSSYAWVIAGPKKGLAYLLADAGYDVWMANARGNTYSRAHVCLPTNPSSPFWDFSFHEIGLYDLPAEMEYILRENGAPQLHFIGHSMGTTAFFVMASMRPPVAAKVASAHALAPVAFVNHMKSPLRIFAPFSNDVEFLARILGRGQLLPENKITQLLAKYGCETLDIEKKLCRNLIFILFGYDPAQFDLELLPLLLSHAAHGASTKTVIHYAQMVNSGKFRQFDYGELGNLRIYNSAFPPSYNISNIKTPVHLYYSSNDWLASTKDVDNLYLSLKCEKTKYLVPLPPFNHIDFILAKDVKKLLYDAVLNQLPKL